LLGDVAYLGDEMRVVGCPGSVTNSGAQFERLGLIADRRRDMRAALEERAHDRMSEVPGRAGDDGGA
jgi:hypothetical protein